MTTHEPSIGSLSLAATVSADGEQSFLRGLLGNHTFSCALTVRGGVCNCQSGHNPSTDPWPYLSTGRPPQKRRKSTSGPTWGQASGV